MSRKQSPGDANRQNRRKQRAAERKRERDAMRQQRRNPAVASRYRAKQHSTAMADAFRAAVAAGKAER